MKVIIDDLLCPQEAAKLIKFFGYTDNGNLRFPKGIAIRDYK